jgi:hypothetical protein
MNIDLNHYYRSRGMVGNLRLVVVANLNYYVHDASVVLVLPILVHLVDIVSFVLMGVHGRVVMVELVIDLNSNLIHLVDY